MDSRVPQPADRRVVNRSAEPSYRPDEPQPANEYQPRSSRGQSLVNQPTPRPSSKKGLIWTFSIITGIIIAGLIGWIVFSTIKNSTTGIDTSRYQAVFLSNGQIYFGKLENFSDSAFRITSVYYPQAETSEEDAEAVQNQGNVQIIRLGDEVHGPDNEMFILKEQVLYYENLKEDSRVSELIEQNETN